MILAYRSADAETDVLGMKHAAKLLILEPKQRCMDIAQEMLTTFNDDPDLLKNVITGDESTQSKFQMFLHI